MQNVVIENVGPISRLVIPCPEEGGLVYLLGHNESGKSRGLEAISEALHKPGASVLELRRGETRGSVQGFGMTLKVGQLTTRRGELEAMEIEGLDPSSAIDPGIDDPVRADRARINTLCDLVLARADVAQFSELVGGPDVLAKYASNEALASAALTDMAEKLKRDFEERARALKSEADKKTGQSSGLVQAVAADIETAREKVATPNELEAESEQAIQALGQLEGRRDEAARAAQTQSTARATLDALRSSPAIDEAAATAQLEEARMVEGVASETLGAATQAVLDAERAKSEAIKRADETITAARLRQNEAATSVSSARLSVRQAQERIDAARLRAESIANAEREAEKAGVSTVEPPSEAEIEAARARRETARAARNHGVLVYAARAKVKKAREDAAVLSAEASAIEQEVDTLREWSQKVWDVVAKVLAPILPKGLSIKGGRLLVEEGRETFFFSDISEGARTDIVIRACAEAVHRQAGQIAKQTGQPKKTPVIVFPQRWGESLDPMRQAEIAKLAQQLGVVIYTARCDAGALRAEVLDGMNGSVS